MWPEEGHLPRRCWSLLLNEACKQNLRIAAPPHPCTPSRFAKLRRPLLLQVERPSTSTMPSNYSTKCLEGKLVH